MKRITLSASCSLVFVLSAQAQGTVIFDQQSYTEEFTPYYASGVAVQGLTLPWGQSFTPTLSSIDFIRLMFDDGNITDGNGASVYLTLRSGAIDGPIIGTTASVTMANGFAGVATFNFPSSIPLLPETTYYFNPVVQGFSSWYIVAGGTYARGHGYNGGAIAGGTEFFFREGIVVPEPSPSLFIMLGAGTFVLIGHRGRPFGDDRL